LMLAGISHDLRTPLARLRLETEMSVPDPSTRELMAADIEQVNTIIDKFMDYARNRQARLEPVDLGEAVTSSLQPLANLPNWAVDAQCPPGLKVWGDAVELRRVLSNLLENAARYGRDPQGQAQVELRATAAGKWVQ
ncbi:histidine kinase dimerization/phospho-acceptor domain-containing protein, partial [Aquabacterium sp. A08]|uniref:histidine kinase dimerization/phospho-acceptor domain-containing protein n=1 Tax=Aquabacterium sp. A08 TaxID=2718532 RepID=UPI0027384AC9